MEATMDKTKLKLTEVKDSLSDQDPEQMLYLGIGVFTAVSIFTIGGTLAIGLIAGMFISVSILLLVFKARKYKPRLWNTICDHPMLTDVILSVGIMTLMATAGGITALIAGGAAGLASSFAIKYFTEAFGKVKDGEEDIPSYKIPFVSKKENNDDETVCNQRTEDSGQVAGI